MWKSISKILSPTIKYENFLASDNILYQQIRTTFILKRANPPFLHKKGQPPRKLRPRHYIYEFVKFEGNEKRKDIDVILTSFVDRLGNVGDKVTVNPLYAYYKLLLPGLAVYASPENLEKYGSSVNKDIAQYSSPYALLTIGTLSRKTVSIIMNKDMPWTLQPWHVRASFRKCGIIMPEEAIKIPAKPIEGPDLNLENKIFFVNITINKKETVDVRCRIHHWSTNLSDKLPYVPEFWRQSCEALFPEEVTRLKEYEENLHRQI